MYRAAPQPRANSTRTAPFLAALVGRSPRAARAFKGLASVVRGDRRFTTRGERVSGPLPFGWTYPVAAGRNNLRGRASSPQACNRVI
jgi:hypothetical protein